jgi:pSer/pThr/pTyr-binding forkhead associated (FHA) protein
MLKIQFKDGRAAPVVLEAPGKTIGKGGVNDIVIDESGVNGFHADVRVDGDSVSITDVKTATGTLVNGVRINSTTLIGKGDVISIGGVELEVVETESGSAKTLVLSGTALLEMGSGCWSLVADSGPEKGQIIPVMDRVEIGRALECDISILEPALSRKHAELELMSSGLTIRDLGSVNGTFVNGKKISETRLQDGDVLQFGKIRFIVSAP